MTIQNIESATRRYIKNQGHFHVLEYINNRGITPDKAMNEYFMSKMGIRRRQLIIDLEGNNTAIIQAGAMMWTIGNIESTSGIKGVGDFVSKLFNSAVTKESVTKPEYKGKGTLALEPTYRHIILTDVEKWNGGLVISDGMFYASDGTVSQGLAMRRNISSAVSGGEGLINLNLGGKGIVALESEYPEEELVEFVLNNEELKIDGNYAICWSNSLQFTVEKSTKSILGSITSGEGLVNVYRGTGRVLMAPML